MTKMLKLLAGLMLAAIMAACGGGGGSSGTTPNGGGTGGGTTPPPAAPTLTLQLVNGAGGAVANNSVTTGSVVYAQATVKNSAGAAVPNKLVVFASGSGLVTFQPVSGQVLTDANGVARVQLIPASLTSSGAETLTASTTVESALGGTTNLSAALDIQTAPANVTLSNFAASQGSLSAFQSTLVSADVSINGAAATSTPVQVSFTSNCGSFSPSQTTSNSAGKAVSTFQATGCAGGTATLSASAVGATAVQTTVSVQAASPTNLLFVSADPSTIYTQQASFGIKQSAVRFRVVDASGSPVGASTNVQISLSASAIASGVVFADTNSTATKTVATDSNGEVSVIVRSGTVPTPLSLDARLVSNPLITASSAGLSVNSGQPSQAFFSLSASTLNIEGKRYDNQSTNLNVFVADRLGQPVPAGTPITFISEGGQVTASCSVVIDTNNKSGCTVSLISQEFRPANGRVTVLAYAEGEEHFIDANGNNKYDLGETFYDMGQAFLDSDEDGIWDAVPAEQKVGDSNTPGAGIGTQACAPHQFLTSNVTGTCDGVWGTTRVRQRIVIAFSDSFAAPTAFFGITTSGGNFIIGDSNGNALPQGSAVTATISGGTNCTVNEVVPGTVLNTTNPTQHRAIISKGSAPGDTCVGAEVSVKVTTPQGNQTLLGSFVIPAP